ncbi:hypothetical protein [Streptomyces sp. NPDC050560]|uniref:hypothetical protein n=1 Tax=Streptomyces sp. NPDC050560 TaxID=3365630 RepID=UPI00378E987E
MSHAPASAPVVRPEARKEPGEVFGPGFTLFADMLLVGLLTAVACLPVVTAPAAFAAASASLRESAASGVQVRLGAYAGHLRARSTPRGLAAGLLPPAVAALLLLDHAAVRAGLPGSAVAAPALLLLALGAAVVGLRATALAAPGTLSAREALLRSCADPRGSALLAGALVLAALLVWSMPLLVPLLPGPLAFAATVMEVRYEAGRGAE